jgi:hypothetical protein
MFRDVNESEKTSDIPQMGPAVALTERMTSCGRREKAVTKLIAGCLV